MKVRISQALKVTSGLAMLLAGQAVMGQESDAPADDEDEIIVTAQRREQKLQDVPIAVTAFSPEFLQNSTSNNLQDLAGYAPNVAVSPGLGNSQTSIFIRGIGSPGNSLGIEPSVGVFIDDVYQARLFGISTDLVDIDRVEILRGPQGTLYGKNTSAGAINIFTAAPDYDDISVRADARYGSFNEVRLRGSISAPLVTDKVAVRLTGSMARSDGYVTNTTLNSDEARKVDQWAVRGKLGFRPTEDLQIELRGFYQNQSENFNVFDFALVAPSTVQLHSVFGLSSQLPSGPFDYRVQQNGLSIDRNKVWGGSLKVDYDFGAATLSSISAYQKFSGLNNTDADFTAIALVRAGEFRNLETASQEIRVASNGDNNVDYVFGLFGTYQKVGNEGFLNVDGVAGSLALSGFRSTALAGARVSGQDNTTTSRGLAGYGQVTFRAAPGFDIIGGLRLGYEKQKHDRFQPGTLAGRFLDGPPLGTNGVLPTQRRSETNVSGNLTAQYFVDNGPVLYATVSRGYKAGGFNSRVLSEARLAFLTFEPEKSTNFEIGSKFVFPEVRGYLNAAVFYTRFTNLQVETNNQIAGATFLTTANAASANNRGIELEGGISPTEGLTLNFSFAYLIAKYGSYRSAPCQVGQVAPACVAASQDLSGRRFGQPALNASASAQYEFPIGAINGLIRADYRFADSYNASDDLDPRAELRAVGLLNTRIGIQDPTGRWSLAAYARNLTNERYFAVVFDAPLQAGSFVGALAERRSLGVEASVRF